jgi:hypothetical protein
MLRPSRLRIDRPVYVFVLYHKAVLPGSAGTVLINAKPRISPRENPRLDFWAYPDYSPEKGNRAMCLARLIAMVSSRWCRAQLPDIRLGRI